VLRAAPDHGADPVTDIVIGSILKSAADRAD